MQILEKDLQELFKNIDFGKDSYELKEFYFETAIAEDKKIIKQFEESIASVVWDKPSGKGTIFFEEKYFKLDSNARLAYLFHEICHLHTYSFENNCETIIDERQTILDRYFDEAKRNRIVSTQELIAKNKYSYILTLFNENLADKLMIKLNSSLLKTKIKSSTESYKSRLNNGFPYHNTPFIIMIDTKRTIELIKENEKYKEQLEALEELHKLYFDFLKGECDKNLFKLFVEYENSFLNLILSEDCQKFVETFEQFISRLITL